MQRPDFFHLNGWIIKIRTFHYIIFSKLHPIPEPTPLLQTVMESKKFEERIPTSVDILL
jgi:hypothetical protein